MLSIKHVLLMMVVIVGRRLSVIGLLGCVILAFVPLGCMSSTQQAAIRYHAQHQGTTDRLSDTTVEHLQECTETYSEQLGYADPPFAHAKAHVQVTPEGQIVDVQVTGIPARAHDLATCTEMSLHAMTVPGSVFSLRRKKAEELATGQTVPKGNEIANPLVLWEVAVILGEFVAQHGGRIVLYTVTIEVLAVVAVGGYKKLSEECRRAKEHCIASCTEATLPTGWLHGVPFHKCMRDCMESAGCF